MPMRRMLVLVSVLNLQQCISAFLPLTKTDPIFDKRPIDLLRKSSRLSRSHTFDVGLSPPNINLFDNDNKNVLSRATLHFDFNKIPYAAGIHHIHSPELIAKAHHPSFQIDGVDEPELSPMNGRNSIGFTCSTNCTKDVRAQMFTSQPNESNLIFFKNNKPLYSIRFKVKPAMAFTSHSLQMDVRFMGLHSEAKDVLMPIFTFANSMEDLLPFHIPVYENPKFMAYRRAVLRGKSCNHFWAMAEHIMHEYTLDQNNTSTTS